MSRVTISYYTTTTIDVDVKDIRKYLVSKGWKESGAYTQYANVFKHDEHYQEIILPKTDIIADFNSRINSLVQTLSNKEGRKVPDIIKDIQKTKIILPIEIKTGLICLALSAVAVGIIAFYLLKPF